MPRRFFTPRTWRERCPTCTPRTFLSSSLSRTATPSSPRHESFSSAEPTLHPRVYILPRPPFEYPLGLYVCGNTCVYVLYLFLSPGILFMISNHPGVSFWTLLSISRLPFGGSFGLFPIILLLLFLRHWTFRSVYDDESVWNEGAGLPSRPDPSCLILFFSPLFVFCRVPLL